MREEAALYAFLVTALIASESLLMSVFGNIYSIYTAYRRDEKVQLARITNTFRILCVILTLIIVMICVTTSYVLHVLTEIFSNTVPFMVFLAIHIIVFLIIIPPIVITANMINWAAFKPWRS
jgi:hypothetical protein